MLKKVLFLVFVLNALTSVVCFSQSNILSKQITLSVQNRSITSVLEQVEKKAGFTFSYNTSIIDGKKIISIDVVNQSVQDILVQILGSKYSFNAYNNQILISLKPANAALIKQNSNPKKKPSVKQIIDTIHVYVNDTIKQTLIDTLVVKKIDTVTVSDTIIVTQTKVEELPRFTFNLSTVYSAIVSSKTMYVFQSQYSDTKNFIKNAESAYRGNDAGLQLDFEYKKIRYRIGIFSSSLTKKIAYSFDKEYSDNGNVYKDSSLTWQYHTVLTYFKFKDGDTVKIPIIDSSQTYKSFEHTKRYIVHTASIGTNTIKLIQIPLSIGYPITLNRNNTFTPYLSTRFYFVSIENGYTFNTTTNNVEPLTKQIVSQFYFSTALSFQYEHLINKETHIFIEPTINQFINPMYRDKRIINERLFQCNIAFGLRTILFNAK